ncbi:hypothetical protein [Trichocoleus sp. FACHB-262]|nr:hypothetical protein [Trichocoleus sp. FACHB-262]
MTTGQCDFKWRMSGNCDRRGSGSLPLSRGTTTMGKTGATGN